MASRLFGDGAGIIALLSLSTSWFFFQEASLIKLDAPLATLSTIFFLSLYEIHRNGKSRQFQIGVFIVAILALLTKYQGILLPLTGVIYVWFNGRNRQTESRSTQGIAWMIASGIAAFFIWVVISFQCGDNLVADIARNFRRIGHLSHHPRLSVPLLDFWMDLSRKIGPILLLCGLILSPFAWRSLFLKDLRLLMLGFWFLILLVFCSSIGLRTPRYFLAAFPVLAVLTGAFFSTEPWTVLFAKWRLSMRLISSCRIVLLSLIVAGSAVVMTHSILKFYDQPRTTYYDIVGLAIQRISSKTDRILITHPQYAYYSERDYFYSQHIPSSPKWIELVSNPANRIQILVFNRPHDFFYYKMPSKDRHQIEEYVRNHFVQAAGVHFPGQLYRRTKW